MTSSFPADWQRWTATMVGDGDCLKAVVVEVVAEEEAWATAAGS